jgi:hydroxymethylbilane synthase
MRALRLGTRGSTLARRQSELVIEMLRHSPTDIDIETVVVQTEGDRRLDVSLDVVGGQGVFVKEIEQRLLDKDIDFAVHSLKDMPAETPDSLVIAAVPVRADARDALVARNALDLGALPPNARIGSDSRRRSAQILALRHDIRVESIRGNVDTRLRKVNEGEYDAVALAVAGLERLGLLARATQIFSLEEVIPSVGQGALAVQCRADDAELIYALRHIDDVTSHAATDAERAFLQTMGAGCRLPVGAYAMIDGEGLRISAIVAGEDGVLHRGDSSGPVRAAARIGQSLAWRLKIEAKV